jgi:hypothetical protein
VGRTGALAAAAASGVPRCEYEVLERKLLGLVTGGRKLYFTGHSIGAGLAAIFAQALHARCACKLTQALALWSRSQVPVGVALMPRAGCLARYCSACRLPGQACPAGCKDVLHSCLCLVCVRLSHSTPRDEGSPHRASFYNPS